MRKFSITYIPASLFLAFLAMILVTCGGGGGGGSSAPAANLTGLSINGPLSMPEYGTATYIATANWDDNTTSTVTPNWSVNMQTASISNAGVLSCWGINTTQTVTVTATYSSGGVTETDNMDVSVTDVATIPFTAQMLSGNAFFEENFYAGGDYDSYLSIFNTDFSFEQYFYEDPPDTSEYVTGTWSIDASGNLIVNNSGQGTVTAMLISDSSTEVQVVVDDGVEPPTAVTLEKIVPVDPTLVPGTYTQSIEGYTWAFSADGTGSFSAFGGCNFTWSVDTSILKVVDQTCSGYKPQLYARAGSQSDATSYTSLNVAVVELTPTDNFYFYYGGYELTRQ